MGGKTTYSCSGSRHGGTALTPCGLGSWLNRFGVVVRDCFRLTLRPYYFDYLDGAFITADFNLVREWAEMLATRNERREFNHLGLGHFRFASILTRPLDVSLQLHGGKRPVGILEISTMSEKAIMASSRSTLSAVVFVRSERA
jgi:hypothetical protein